MIQQQIQTLQLQVLREIDQLYEKEEQKEGVRNYQKFISNFFLKFGQMNDILIYHTMGSGKTVTAINVYNTLYLTFGNNFFVVIMIKKQFQDEPWLKELQKWLKNNDQSRNIHFVFYDQKDGYQQFIKAQMSNQQQQAIFIIDEAHQFLRSVQVQNEKMQADQETDNNGQFRIYNQLKKLKHSHLNKYRIILISGTPITHEPYQLSYMFNLFQKDLLPENKEYFNDLYIHNNRVNQGAILSLFKRVYGLVSYYRPKLVFHLSAKKITRLFPMKMASHQSKVYEALKQQSRQLSRSMLLFAPPQRAGIDIAYKVQFPKQYNQDYLQELEKIFGEIQKQKAREDLKRIADMFGQNKMFQKMFDPATEERESIALFNTFANELQNQIQQSQILSYLFGLSVKYTILCVLVLAREGLHMVYCSLVHQEGVQTLKKFLDFFGISSLEFTGDVQLKERIQDLIQFNSKENLNGSKFKVIIVSSVGQEGININNVLTMHLLTPPSSEGQKQQVIGRVVRQLSHQYTPDATAFILEYLIKDSSDMEDYERIKNQQVLIDDFQDVLKNSAIDCQVNNEDTSDCYNFPFEFYEMKKIQTPDYYQDVNLLLNYVPKKVPYYLVDTIELEMFDKYQEEDKVKANASKNYVSIINDEVYDKSKYFLLGKLYRIQNIIQIVDDVFVYRKL